MAFYGQKYVASQDEIKKAKTQFLLYCIFFIIFLAVAFILSLSFKSPTYIFGSILTIYSAIYNSYMNIENNIISQVRKRMEGKAGFLDGSFDLGDYKKCIKLFDRILCFLWVVGAILLFISGLGSISK